MDICLKCGGTGVLINGEKCDCGCMDDFVLPTAMHIPSQYQNVRFEKSFLPKWLQNDYGEYMDKLLIDCTIHLHTFQKNILICAPPNSGKTIFTYTVYGLLYAKGQNVSSLIDIMEAREIIMNYYNVNYQRMELLSNAKIAMIKIPQDLPLKFAETISMIIERRVRNGCSTIFLFSGSQEDLIAQDKFGKFKALLGDGSYNSIEIKSWRQEGGI
ncbi:MAG: hypothetical protein HFI05_02215 [Lachnospiraceae bacterium]|jgi:hypothetical protein|nr:hypothetical protein [Lachnospiraceae bacterium]